MPSKKWGTKGLARPGNRRAGDNDDTTEEMTLKIVLKGVFIQQMEGEGGT